MLCNSTKLVVSRHSYLVIINGLFFGTTLYILSRLSCHCVYKQCAYCRGANIGGPVERFGVKVPRWGPRAVRPLHYKFWGPWPTQLSMVDTSG